MRKPKFDILFPCMLALATLAILSCQPTGGKGNDGQKGDNGEEVLFLTDSVHVSKNIDSIMSIDYDFQFLKPGNTVADSINAGINRLCISGSHDADVCTAISMAIDKEVNEMKAEVVEFYEPDDETFGEIQFYINRKGRFDADAADTVMVYQSSIDQYTGGAHGSYIPYTLNFSKRTGLVIGIGDVLDATQEQAILDIMLAKLLKDNNCSTREELMEKTGILGLGELYLTENFQLGKDSITFCFGQYDIAPYASGITYISLSYDSLKQYLKTN